jgi:hypothetical protein
MTQATLSNEVPTIRLAYLAAFWKVNGKGAEGKDKYANVSPEQEGLYKEKFSGASMRRDIYLSASLAALETVNKYGFGFLYKEGFDSSQAFQADVTKFTKDLHVDSNSVKKALKLLSKMSEAEKLVLINKMEGDKK